MSISKISVWFLCPQKNLLFQSIQTSQLLTISSLSNSLSWLHQSVTNNSIWAEPKPENAYTNRFRLSCWKYFVLQTILLVRYYYNKPTFHHQGLPSRIFSSSNKYFNVGQQSFLFLWKYFSSRQIFVADICSLVKEVATLVSGNM